MKNTKSLYAFHQEIIDNRSSDQLMHDIKQANELRASAERLEFQGSWRALTDLYV